MHCNDLENAETESHAQPPTSRQLHGKAALEQQLWISCNTHFEATETVESYIYELLKELDLRKVSYENTLVPVPGFMS